MAVFGELVQRLATSQPRQGGKVVILARNDPCGLPALPTPPSGSQFLSSTGTRNIMLSTTTRRHVRGRRSDVG